MKANHQLFMLPTCLGICPHLCSMNCYFPFQKKSKGNNKQYSKEAVLLSYNNIVSSQMFSFVKGTKKSTATPM